MSESQLTEARGNVLNKILLTGVYKSNAMMTFVPLLVASHDRITNVYRPAEDALKKLVGQADFENKELIDGLYKLVLGDRESLAVKQAIQLHIIQLLTRSKYALNENEKLVKLIEICFETDGRNIRTMKVGIELIRSISKNTNDEGLSLFVNDLIVKLYEWIMSSGWPRLTVNDIHQASLRRQTYETLGALIRRRPEILNNNQLEIIKFLFESLAKDSNDMKPSIQEALSEILPVLNYLSDESRGILNDLLFNYLSNPVFDQSCKYVSIRYSIRSNGFDSPIARLICLLGLNKENRPDVIEEAKRGLNPFWFRNANSPYEDSSSVVKFPLFNEMLQIIQERLFRKSSGEVQLQSSYIVYDASVTFLEQILVMEAVQGKKTVLSEIDDNWDGNLESSIIVDQVVRDYVKNYINTELGIDQVVSFMELIFYGVKLNNPDSPNCLDIWLRILSQSGPLIISQNIRYVKEILPLIESGKPKLIQTASNALAIIITSDEVSIDDIVVLLTNWLEPENNAISFKYRGHLLSIGYIISRLKLRNRQSQLPEEIFNQCIKSITDVILQTRATDSSSIETAVDSFSQLALCGAISDSLITPELISKLLSLAKSDNDKAIFAIGCICNSATDPQSYIDSIFDLHDSKQIDFMFMSGEALTIAAAGWNSTLTERYKDIQGVELVTSSKASSNLLENVLDQVLTKCRSPKPSLRRFSCIWLLSLTKYCGTLPEAKTRLEQIHLAFMRFLVDRDDIVQESASRGLSLVYDMADNTLKDNMVRGLIQSFTSDKSTTNGGTVTAETQLFEPGVLDTGDGSISTYKDILSLASEVGDPSLVYKFMTLAANSSLWQSRKGAAFGLNTIFSKANLEDLFESNPRLSKNLIPKLYRYRFDPSSSVQESMKGIWNALIKDNTTVINNNFIDILEELLSGMGNREWRIRQASTLALSELLQGKLLEQYESHLQKIWFMSFRVVDDIKESVRIAGMQLTRGLATSLVRHIDIDTGAASERQATSILKDLIPFLMGNSGIQSESKEVQSFSLQTLLKLCKSNSPPLKPYIPGLIEELLGLLSTLEPQAMNYLALNADKYGLTSNDIDASRMSSLRSSPMMEAIEQMIDRLDNDSLSALIPKLSLVIRKSVGLPSKLGASRVVVALVMRNIYQVTPFAQTLLSACRSQLMDRNNLVSQSYAVSCGYLCRPASIEAVVDYVKYLQRLYFESPDVGERARLVAGLSVNAISKHASDKFSSIASSLLPFIFIAKHDPDTQVKEVFEHSWNDNTGGTGAIKLYVNEIIAIVRNNLSSQQWDIRQVAAKSVAEAAVGFGNDSNEQDILALFDILIQASSGRSWKGKELILDAVVTLAINVKEKIGNELLEKLNALITTEVKRRNKEYQIEAIQSVGKYICGLKQVQLYDVFFEVCMNYLNPEEEEEDSDGDTNMEDSNRGISEDTRLKILEGAVKSFIITDNKEILATIVGYLYNSLQQGKVPVSWKTKLAVPQHVITLADLYTDKNVSADDSQLFLKLWSEIVKVCSRDSNHEKVRVESARAAGALLKIASDKQIILTDVDVLLNEEVSPVVLTELRKAIN